MDKLLYILEETLKFFLNAKAWQLFLLLFGSMLAAPLVGPTLPNPIIGIAVASLILMGLFTGWWWSIATAANEKLDPSLKKSTKWMVLGLIYTAVYFLGVLLFISSSTHPTQEIPKFILPMHLLAMYAIVYAMLFTAKRLVTLERKQEVTFFEYSGPFFLLWFFPIGVWFIQPKVNKTLGKSAT